jgi:hypothetical protein
MNTPSHLLINAALAKAGRGRGLPIARGAFLLGAVLPDIPLFVLWIGAYVYYRHLLGDATVSPMDPRFDQLYLTNPFWIASHNLLHGPVLLLSGMALLWRFRATPERRGHWWFWFFAGCLLHTAFDIPTHVNDGPLLFFPFDWSYRFVGPISYWDSRYYGREFALFELGLNLLLLVYVLLPWLRRRLARATAGRPSSGQP